MKYKSVRLNNLSKNLLAFLNKQKGYFLHGNNIRFAVHLSYSESSLLFMLGRKPSVVIKEIIDREFKGLSNCIRYDNEKIYLDPKNLLIELAASHKFYTVIDANTENLSFIESSRYPFVIIVGDMELYKYREKYIPVSFSLESNTVIVGKGDEYLVSKHPISEHTLEILARYPTTVKF